VPNLRAKALQPDNTLWCSSSFDPLADAPDDLDVVGSYTRFRAYIADRTTIDGQAEKFFAGVKEDSAFLYVQAAGAGPVLIDTNDDGLCDAIAPEVIANQRGIARLEPVPVQGEYQFAPADYTTAPAVTGCTPHGSNPHRLCAQQASELEVVVSQEYRNQENNITAIFGVSVGGADITCTGGQSSLPALTGIDEGWICAAAAVSDGVGNADVSAPLRLCLDNGSGAAPACANGQNPPPCTDGCTPPSRSPEGDDVAGEPIPFTVYYR
jgi:hypothetical protein